jgi:hypothetical protein
MGMLAAQACAAGRSKAQTLLDIILDAVWLLQRSRLLTPGFVQCIHAFLLQARSSPALPRHGSLLWPCRSHCLLLSAAARMCPVSASSCMHALAHSASARGTGCCCV